jgi:hypothetical protein
MNSGHIDYQSSKKKRKRKFLQITNEDIGENDGVRVRARERERLLSRARASFSDGDLFVKNEDLMLEDIWRRGDCESGAVGNTVRGLHCDEEGRCW